MSIGMSVVAYQPVYKAAFKDLNIEWIAKTFQVEKKDLEQLEHPESCLALGGEIFFVLDQGEAVGTCAMCPLGEGRFEIAKMAVRPDYRGNGLGDLLMIEVEKWAMRQEAKELVILSNTVLEAAIKLYRKHGFVVHRLGGHPDYARCNIEMRKPLLH